MKKDINKIIVVLVAIMISFFIGVNSAKALDKCDFENNYGSISESHKPHVEIGDTNYGMSRISYWCYNGKTAVGAAAKSTCDNASGKFYIQFNVARETSKDGGYVKNTKFTIYNKKGDAQCYIEYDESSKKYGVYQYNFNLNKKEVGKIVVEGTYYTGEKDKKFGKNEFNINHDGDSSGDTHTTKKGTTSTSIDGDVIGGGAASGTKKGKAKKEAIKTNKSGEIINSLDKDEACTEVSGLIHDYWKYVMVIVPILLIVMITIDFFKALAKGDSDSIKKAGNNTIKRAIAAVVLLALPALLGLIFSWVGLDLCV